MSTAYVGKSVDMVGRYAQHMHEYRHRGDFDGVEIEKAYFASVDDGTDGGVLDGYLNLKRPDGAHGLPSWDFWHFRLADYAAADGVVFYKFDGAHELKRALEKPAFLD